MSRKGISFIELIVAMLILAITFAGLVNLFISGKRWALISETRMTGGELGKFFIDPLQNQVNWRTWSTAANCLGTGNGAACPNPNAGAAQGVDRTYNATYTITNNNPAPDLNRVRVNINWNVQ